MEPVAVPVEGGFDRALDEVRHAHLPVARARVGQLAEFAGQLARGEDVSTLQVTAADLAHQLSGSLGLPGSLAALLVSGS